MEVVLCSTEAEKGQQLPSQRATMEVRNESSQWKFAMEVRNGSSR